MLAAAINQMVAQNETITESPKDCEDSGVLWDSGKMIFQYLKTRNIRGMTGQVAFDDNGDRINAEYEVVNTREGKNKTVIGRFFYHEVRNSIVHALTKDSSNSDCRPAGGKEDAAKYQRQPDHMAGQIKTETGRHHHSDPPEGTHHRREALHIRASPRNR